MIFRGLCAPAEIQNTRDGYRDILEWDTIERAQTCRQFSHFDRLFVHIIVDVGKLQPDHFCSDAFI
jgi:hypothetical protein